MDRMSKRRLVFEEHFDGASLDRTIWLPHYLPAWSSRAATAATYVIHDSCLHLSILPAQRLWLAGEHDPPLRVSGVQSGNFSEPVGSTIGQQPYRAGATVREAQATFWGWTPSGGYRGAVRTRRRIRCRRCLRSSTSRTAGAPPTHTPCPSWSSTTCAATPADEPGWRAALPSPGPAAALGLGTSFEYRFDARHREPIPLGGNGMVAAWLN